MQRSRELGFRGSLAIMRWTLVLGLLAVSAAALAFGGLGAGALGQAPSEPAARILVFSRTTGFRHASIAPGLAAIRELGQRGGFVVDATEDPGRFTPSNLARYRAVVWLNTSGDVLGGAQRAAFQRYIEAGGGYVGIHAAAATERGWRWYGTLLAGARLRGHPAPQRATILVEDRTHPSTRSLPRRWRRLDEWYAFRHNPRPRAHVLATLSEATYKPGPAAMGRDHPIAWCRTLGSGQAWYTAGGHTKASFSEPRFRAHLRGGILSAAGLAPNGRCATRG